MTAIAALAGADASGEHAARTARALASMRARGADHTDVWTGGGAALGIARFTWETAQPGTGAMGVVRRGPLAIVADATLYYRDALCRGIEAAGVPAKDDTAADLILSAYSAFGDACAARLEGDFAFVLWDEQRGRLFAARDFVGKRSLYYSASDRRLWLASTVAGVLADERVPRDFNIAAIGAVAAGLWVNTARTAYQAVLELPAGHSLVWDGDATPVISRFWQPPTRVARVTRSPRAMDEAAAELLSLLTDATDQRMAPDGKTGVSLSGGWDSTAVFGAGHNAMQRHPLASRTLDPVSISYPVGDAGREDELIAETTARWDARPAWIDVDTIPMFAGAAEAARNRDEPWSHPYEQWNRALARATRDTGARVLLDGVGGDSLFQVSGVFLADLFRQGRWIELMRQWRMGGGSGVRALFGTAIKPALPPLLVRLLAAVRGAGRPGHYLDRKPSFWMKGTFLAQHAVLEHELSGTPSLPRSNAVLAETHAYLLYPAFPRLMGRLFGFALSEGVELRSPLMDARVVSFATTRPWFERADGAETKVLLRRSMRGLLPERLLAPRPHRTGVTSGYFNRCLQGAAKPVVDAMLQDSALESIGAINLNSLKRAWEYYLSSGDDEIGVRVYFTIQAELWLRGHGGAANVHA